MPTFRDVTPVTGVQDLFADAGQSPRAEMAAGAKFALNFYCSASNRRKFAKRKGLGLII